MGEVHRVLKKGGVFICFEEPYLDYFHTHFKTNYNTFVNFISYIKHKVKNRKYNSDIICRYETRKYLYSIRDIKNRAERKGFTDSSFYRSNVLFPYFKVIFAPFRYKFPKRKHQIDCMLIFIYKLDFLFFEKVLPRMFLNRISFYLKKAKE